MDVVTPYHPQMHVIDRLDDVSELQYHHEGPYDSASFYPPGVTSPEGNTYDYSEGSNMHMTDRDMNFMWIPGTKFTDADFANDPFYSGDQVGLLRGIGSLLNRLRPRKAAA
ncbi:hypothetical protein V8E54_007677 [Elaphomyces granulatus]